MSLNNTLTPYVKPREHLFDFYRSIFMLFVFFHHTYLSWHMSIDFMVALNPFAELFVGLSGFMVGYVYLHRTDYSSLVTRGIIIFAVYYMVSLPVAIGSAVIGLQKEPILNTVIKCVFMLDNYTSISILRFYGLIFICLPIILRMYKVNKRALVYASSFIFIVATFFYQSFLYEIDSFFINQAVLLLLQWQIFFVFGLFLGDMYRSKMLSVRSINIFLSVSVVIGIVLQYSVHDMMSFDKSPYTFSKYINLMWSGPIILFLFYLLYNYLRGGIFDRFIRVVGRNSLISFVASEIVMQSIKLFLVFNRNVFHWRLPSVLPYISGILAIFAVASIMWAYEYYVKGYVGLAKWSR